MRTLLASLLFSFVLFAQAPTKLCDQPQPSGIPVLATVGATVWACVGVPPARGTWVQVYPSTAGTGLFTIQNDGTAIGSPRAIINFPLADGITNAITDDGTKIVIAQTADVTPAKQLSATNSQICTSASASTTAYTAVCAFPFQAYAAKQFGMWYVDVANTTTTPTVDLDTQGPKSVRDKNGNPLAIGALKAATEVLWSYDGTYVRCITCDAVPYLDYQKAASTITGNGSYQTIYTKTVAANALAAGHCISMDFSYLGTLASGSDAVRLSWGGTIATLSNNATWFGQTVFWSVSICNDPGSTTAQQINIKPAFRLGAGNWDPPSSLVTSAINTVSTVVLKLEFTGTGADTVTPKWWKLEIN